jgi:hypothetical protein
MPNTTENVTVVTSTKSMGIAVLLTILFGPLGMLYSTIVGAIIMSIISAIVGFITVGIGLLVTWPICVIWAAIAVNNFNKNLTS